MAVARQKTVERNFKALFLLSHPAGSAIICKIPLAIPTWLLLVIFDNMPTQDKYLFCFCLILKIILLTASGPV
jgi:hypothetical protein